MIFPRDLFLKKLMSRILIWKRFCDKLTNALPRKRKLPPHRFDLGSLDLKVDALPFELAGLGLLTFYLGEIIGLEIFFLRNLASFKFELIFDGELIWPWFNGPFVISNFGQNQFLLLKHSVIYEEICIRKLITLAPKIYLLFPTKMLQSKGYKTDQSIQLNPKAIKRVEGIYHRL